MKALKIIAPLIVLLGIGVFFFLRNQGDDPQTTSQQGTSSPKSLENAADIANSWAKILDNEEYKKSWEQTSKFFQGQVPLNKWMKAIAGVRKPFGKFVSRTTMSKKYRNQLKGAPDGHYVVIKFNSKFQKKSSAVETITVYLEDKEWKIAGYFIK